MINNIPIILASASPRRKELLEQAGFSFTVTTSDADESITYETPEHFAETLALRKADSVYNKIKSEYKDQNFVVIGADTIVYYDGEILGKPADEDEAFDMLTMLCDRTHQVYTGVAVIYRNALGKQVELINEKTDVTLYPATAKELKEYINTGDPLDKAGAYGIQGPFAVHVKEICGDYNNVVGLPIAKLYQTLKSMDIISY
jgi:septum formation protein